MAHFAKLDDSNIVLEVIVLNNAVIDNLPFPESEPVGIEFLIEWSGGYTHWLQTSYNATFRKNYAGIGFTYDPTLDAFIRPQPFPSWTLNTTTCQWEAPVPYPTDGKDYYWDEATLSWVLEPTFPEPNEDWVV
jgi:hypothetical protein